MCFFFLSSERQPSCSGPHHNTINTVALQTAYYCWHEYCLKPDYCVDPIPSFGFGFGRKNESHSCKIEIGFSRGDGARVIRFFARVIQQLGFWTQKIQASVDYCYVPRRVECTSLGPGLKHPILRSTLVWPRRDVPRRFTWYFFQRSIRTQHVSCCSV